MDSISLAKASQLTSPNPVTIVCTQRPDGGTNLATVSWWTYLSFNPSMVAFAMAKTSYSGERTRETGKAVIAVPGEELAGAVVSCGTSTGHKADKAAQFGIELEELPGSDIRIPQGSRVAIQCALREFVEVGDHYLYICDVEQVLGDESKRALFAWNGYAEIAPAEKAL